MTRTNRIHTFWWDLLEHTVCRIVGHRQDGMWGLCPRCLGSFPLDTPRRKLRTLEARTVSIMLALSGIGIGAILWRVTQLIVWIV